MSQQPNDSSPDQSMKPFPGSLPPTSGHAAPVTVPQVAAPSTSFSVSITIPPPDRELDSRFSRMSLQASLSASSSQPQDLRTLLVSSRSTAVASSNVGPRTGPVTMSGATLGTWSATSTLPPNTISVPLPDSDPVTWTDTVSPTFPGERLVSWASSAWLPNLTDAYRHVISTPRPTASSTQGSSRRIVYHHPPRRVSLYRPSAGSLSDEAVRPLRGLLSDPTVTSWPVPVVASSLRTVETPSLYNSSMPLPDSTTGPTSTPLSQLAQLAMAPSYVSQPQSYQQLPQSPTYADFHTQRTMNSPTRTTLERIYNRLSHSNARSSTRNCPYSRSVTDISDQRVTYRSRRFLAPQLTPATTSTASLPVTVQSSDSVLVQPVNQEFLALAQNMDCMQRLLREEKHLHGMRKALEKVKMALVLIEQNSGALGESSTKVLRKEAVTRINDLYRSVTRQEEVVRRLRLTLPAGVVQLAPTGHQAARSQQRQGGQSEMHVENNEEGIWHQAARSPQRLERQPEIHAEEVEEEEMPDQQL